MIFLKKIFSGLIQIIENIFKFWIIESFFFFKELFGKLLRKLERIFAVRINIHYLFTPLYQDYTLIGYALGFPARLVRITLGILIYLLFFVVFLAAYIIWSLFPLFAFCKFLYSV